MKSAGFLVLLLVTVVFLWFAGAWHFERALRRQFHVGEATIPLPTAETVLSDDMVTQLVLFALASNSIPVSNWTFEPSLQNAPSVVSRSIIDSNHVSVTLTSATVYSFGKKKAGGRKLRARVEVTNGLAH